MSALIGHEALEAALGWPDLIGQLRDWYCGNAVQAPDRQVLSIAQPDGSEASLLIMPAWVPGESIGVKVVTFFPATPPKGARRSMQGICCLMAKPDRCRRRWMATH
ncbi:hypothetical protein [Sulfitobacter profundi]|uniref:Ornithine cyclodeaminase n=1 Tax=Sulfitobacter profundi TaxID=2679961 RepID=A0ABW1YV09_9RHOB